MRILKLSPSPPLPSSVFSLPCDPDQGSGTKKREREQETEGEIYTQRRHGNPLVNVWKWPRKGAQVV